MLFLLDRMIPSRASSIADVASSHLVTSKHDAKCRRVPRIISRRLYCYRRKSATIRPKQNFSYWNRWPSDRGLYKTSDRKHLPLICFFRTWIFAHQYLCFIRITWSLIQRESFVFKERNVCKSPFGYTRDRFHPWLNLGKRTIKNRYWQYDFNAMFRLSFTLARDFVWTYLNELEQRW